MVTNQLYSEQLNHVYSSELVIKNEDLVIKELGSEGHFK